MEAAGTAFEHPNMAPAFAWRLGRLYGAAPTAARRHCTVKQLSPLIWSSLDKQWDVTTVGETLNIQSNAANTPFPLPPFQFRYPQHLQRLKDSAMSRLDTQPLVVPSRMQVWPERRMSDFNFVQMPGRGDLPSSHQSCLVTCKDLDLASRALCTLPGVLS